MSPVELVVMNKRVGHALGLRHTREYRDIMYFFGYGSDIPEYFGGYRSRLRSRADIAKGSDTSRSPAL